MSARRTYITQDEQKRYENIMDAISDLRIVLAQQGHAMMVFALFQMLNEMDNLMTVWINRMSSQSSPESGFYGVESRIFDRASCWEDAK